MKIGELVKATGIEAETLRYYEKIGLLQRPERGDNGYRHYGDWARQQVGFIRHCRELSMSLVEIKRMLDLSGQPEADCDEVNQIVDAHLEQIRLKQEALARLEQQLLVLRGRCTANRRAGDCGILQDLVAASEGAHCACHGIDPRDA